MKKNSIEEVVLVNQNDSIIGKKEKMAAHQDGDLHRAFSIFVFNSKKEVMLQQRALDKYHSAGLWSNTCCSHPRSGEELTSATHRRLQEEMGFNTELEEKFPFIYKAQLGDLIEYELDHIFFGSYESKPKINPQEVADWKWIGWDDLKQEISQNPDNYTYWLKVAVGEIEKRNLLQ